MDPFILDVQPRLISSKGTTIVTVMGYGFVQMEESKSMISLNSGNQALKCSENSICQNIYHVDNEHSAQVGTNAQSTVTLAGQNIGFNAWNMWIMNPDGDYTPNNINLWYYKDLVFTEISAQFAYSNEEKPLILKTNFNWNNGNNFQQFRKHATLTCRFTSTSDVGLKVVVPAIMETSPIGSYNKDQLPD